MKAPILFIVATVLMLALVACGGQQTPAPTQPPAKPASDAAQQPAKPASNAADQSAQAQPRANDKLKFVDSGVVPSYAVVWVGVDQGIFAKNGLDISLITAQSTTSAIQSMVAGEAQMGNSDPVGALTANQKGANLMTVMSLQRTIPFELFVRKEIQTPQDLKGKKVAISRFGGASYYMTRAMLTKLGLNPDTDVTFIQIGQGAERTAGLLNNSIQATVVQPPEPAVLGKEPSVRLLAKLSDMGIVYPYFSMITTRSYLNDHRDVVKRFVKGYVESLQFFATHKEESMAVMSNVLRITDKAMLENAYQSTVEISYVKPYVPSDASMIYEYSEQDTKEPITVKWDDTYDNSFVKELDESGYIDKIFEGVKDVVREVPAHK